MAMNGNTLGTAIKDALKSGGFLPPDISAPDEAAVAAVWQTIAGAIVSHIQNNAVVSTTVTTTVTGSVAAGQAVSVDDITHTGQTDEAGTVSGSGSGSGSGGVA